MRSDAATEKRLLVAVVMSRLLGPIHLENREEAFLGVIQVICIGLVFCVAVWRVGSRPRIRVSVPSVWALPNRLPFALHFVHICWQDEVV
jgi:hypothetical protein